MKTALIIPTLNAGSLADRLLASVRSQSVSPDEFLVIDSGSTDGTSDCFTRAGVKVATISRATFDHGRVRQLATRMMGAADLLIFLTQDALPAHPTAFENLLHAFRDPAVGAAYGRQLPRPGAGPFEAHARLFNYPYRSRVKSLADAPELGIKTPFISNSFAAYRRTALEAVGGFPKNVILSEDTFVAARMLLAGWRIAYCAEAQVYHSHNYSCLQEFRRYFDTGVFHAREPWIRERFGAADGEGRRFVRSELRFLWPGHGHLLPAAALRNGLKYLGFRLGLREKTLPCWLKPRLSLQPGFWKKPLSPSGQEG